MKKQRIDSKGISSAVVDMIPLDLAKKECCCAIQLKEDDVVEIAVVTIRDIPELDKLFDVAGLKPVYVLSYKADILNVIKTKYSHLKTFTPEVIAEFKNEGNREWTDFGASEMRKEHIERTGSIWSINAVLNILIRECFPPNNLIQVFEAQKKGFVGYDATKKGLRLFYSCEDTPFWLLERLTRKRGQKKKIKNNREVGTIVLGSAGTCARENRTINYVIYKYQGKRWIKLYK